jgi:hypothetical protein
VAVAPAASAARPRRLRYRVAPVEEASQLRGYLGKVG